MQDPAAFGLNQMIPMAAPAEQEQLRCPRCDSINTKFCYYNNYNLSQPRHFCKACRRYWTKGGALRNIPVGGASRKSTKRSSSSNSKRASSSSTSTSSSGSKPPAPAPAAAAETTPGPGAAGLITSSSLLGSTATATGQFGRLLDVPGSGNGQPQNPALEMPGGGGGGGAAEGFMGLGGLQIVEETSCWSGNSNDAWPDLAIYTPDSRFQ